MGIIESRCLMMWYENLTWWTILDAYLVFIVAAFLIKLVLHSKRILNLVLFLGIMLLLDGVAIGLNLPMSKDIFGYIITAGPIVLAIIAAPDIRLTLDSLWKEKRKTGAVVMGNDRTKTQIAHAVFALSKDQIGALITIEKHNTLDQYAQRAITLNSEVSSELLINIFTPNTPLHDGAVIIRGDRILCAGAYFVLSANENFEKTTGSRHRAALGISEMTDSFTVIVSEETGKVSVAINGVMTKMKDQDALLDYLNLFMI